MKPDRIYENDSTFLDIEYSKIKKINTRYECFNPHNFDVCIIIKNIKLS